LRDDPEHVTVDRWTSDVDGMPESIVDQSLTIIWKNSWPTAKVERVLDTPTHELDRHEVVPGNSADVTAVQYQAFWFDGT